MYRSLLTYLQVSFENAAYESNDVVALWVACLCGISFDMSVVFFWHICWSLLKYLLVSFDISVGVFGRIYGSVLTYSLVSFSISISHFWHICWNLLTSLLVSFDTYRTLLTIWLNIDLYIYQKNMYVKRDVYMSKETYTFPKRLGNACLFTIWLITGKGTLSPFEWSIFSSLFSHLYSSLVT